MAPEHDDEIDLGALWQRLFARWRGTSVLLLVGGAVGFALSYAVPPVYTSRATLMPQFSAAPTGLIGRLASLSALGSEFDNSNEVLYGEVLRSDLVLDRVIARTWTVRGEPAPQTLYAVLGVDGAGSGEAVAPGQAFALKKKLRSDVVKFSRDPVTGFMRVAVSIPRDPELAAAIANFIVDELDVYNRQMRTRKAREHREFVDARLLEVSAHLAEAESAQTRFQLENVMYLSSPRLRQEFGVLEREAQAQRAIWLQLRADLESAKIEEHKEMTSIQVLDRAVAPVRRTSPVRSVFALAGGLVLAVGGNITLSLRARRGHRTA